MPIDIPTSCKRNNSQLITTYNDGENINPRLVRLRKKKKRDIDKMIENVHEKHNQQKWESHLEKVPSLPLEEEESEDSDEDDGTDPDSKVSDNVSNPLASSNNS